MEELRAAFQGLYDFTFGNHLLPQKFAFCCHTFPLGVEIVPNRLVKPASTRQARNATSFFFWIKRREVVEFHRNAARCAAKSLSEFDNLLRPAVLPPKWNAAVQIHHKNELVTGPGLAYRSHAAADCSSGAAGLPRPATPPAMSTSSRTALAAATGRTAWRPRPLAPSSRRTRP